jgi:hypothetical protein
MRTAIASITLGLGVSLVACGGDEFRLDGGADARPRTDAMSDRATIDTPIPDATTDSSIPDATLDSPIDAPNDVPIDVPIDASLDTASDTPRDTAPDALPDTALDAPVDAGATGRCTPTINGTIATDWTNDVRVVNTVATAWAGNELRALHVCYDATRLYFGIEGTVEFANGIVVYIDRDFAGGSGGSATGISSLSALTDSIGDPSNATDPGGLDNRISAPLALGTMATGFGAEGAWGTAGMRTLASTALDAFVGLRLFWPAGGTASDGGALPDRRGDFAWITGAQSTCVTTGTGSCEVAIDWTALFEGPRPATTTIALFVRINSTDGSMSANQTLPMDNATLPQTVNRVVLLDVRP